MFWLYFIDFVCLNDGLICLIVWFDYCLVDWLIVFDLFWCDFLLDWWVTLFDCVFTCFFGFVFDLDLFEYCLICVFWLLVFYVCYRLLYLVVDFVILDSRWIFVFDCLLICCWVYFCWFWRCLFDARILIWHYNVVWMVNSSWFLCFWFFVVTINGFGLNILCLLNVDFMICCGLIYC